MRHEIEMFSPKHWGGYGTWDLGPRVLLGVGTAAASCIVLLIIGGILGISWPLFGIIPGAMVGWFGIPYMERHHRLADSTTAKTEVIEIFWTLPREVQAHFGSDFVDRVLAAPYNADLRMEIESLAKAHRSLADKKKAANNDITGLIVAARDAKADAQTEINIINSIER